MGFHLRRAAEPPGEFAKQDRDRRDEQRYGTRSLRVLTVTSGPKRLENLKREAEQVKGGRVFWFTTTDRITANMVVSMPIWLVDGSTTPEMMIPPR